MADWTKSMQQSFEYYIVDPQSWNEVRKLDTIISCTITRDNTTDTLESASFETTEILGECYVRVYLITIQNRIRERHCLGTFLCQTPTSSFNGLVGHISIDAYSPLLELKEKMPPIGYYIPKGTKIMERARMLTDELMRPPVGDVIDNDSDVETFTYEEILNDDGTLNEIIENRTVTKGAKVLNNNFSSNTDDTWFVYLTSLMSNAKYYYIFDDTSKIMFQKQRNTSSLSPVYVFDDGNSSILYPDLSYNHDIYGIPNTVEVIYSDNGKYFYSKVVNEDPTSPVSTVSRGREILHRVTNPEITGVPTQFTIDEYAKNLLRELSSIEYEITYTHGYCPVRPGDCVRIDYEKSGLPAKNAVVKKQTIRCKPGCEVSETSIFTETLWEDKA